MIRLKTIQNELLHLVGWEREYDPELNIYNKVTETESGLYFQGAHPLLTLNNIRAVMPDDFGRLYEDWKRLDVYKKGTVVRSNGEYWIALMDNTGKEPNKSDFSSDFNDDYDIGGEWARYSILSDFLERETRTGIATTIQRFIEMKLLQKETKNILENRTFFDGSGNLRAMIDNQGRACGYEIIPVRSMGVTTKINKIGLQMYGGAGKVTLYIFHSNSLNPRYVIECNVQGKGNFEWFPVQDIYLPYIDSIVKEKDEESNLSTQNNSGGSWYIVYNQADLPDGMRAIDINKDWSKEPCNSCGARGDIQKWRELTKYMEIHPFKAKVPSDFGDFPELWDIERNIYTTANNYGINLEFTVGCDITDFIVEQRSIFANVVQKQVAYNLLRRIAMNPEARVNRNQINVSRMDVLYELDGNTAGRAGGLGLELEKGYKALSFDTKGLDRICLGCNNGGVKYRTV